jgi:HTH-type transcriptional regulator/antitoxin HigA
MNKVIKNQSDYEAALAAVDALAAKDPAPGTADGDELELLAVLISDYESREFPISAVDPVEAIRVRMEQQDLSPRDLVPFIGSRSKVSEVLSGKRPLSLTMIRALHTGLGIPASALVQEASSSAIDNSTVDWERFPVREMALRGWLPNLNRDTAARAPKPALVEAVRTFFAPLGSPLAAAALYRKSDNVRSARTMDQFALTAWTARVMLRAQMAPVDTAFIPGTVTPDFMRDLARLSWSDQGPILASEFLSSHGIKLIIEPHLPKTHLDGAALMINGNHPIVAMTLRFDRLDNFWFVLMHELAHVALHYESDRAEFFDDLEYEDQDPREREADLLAGEVLIPQASWEQSPASRLRSASAVQHLARSLRIHPAIVAGRIRREFRSYRVLSDLVGQGCVRKHFTDVAWLD